jgi:hypothetical protein
MYWSYGVQLTLVIVFGVSFASVALTMIFVRKTVTRRKWRMLLLLALFLLGLALAAISGLRRFDLVPAGGSPTQLQLFHQAQ